MFVYLSTWQSVSGASAADLGTGAGVWGAPCTCCTEVGGWVSRLGSCDVQWELFGTRTEENSESSIFLFIHNWNCGYQEYKAFTRVLTVPWEVVKCTPLLQFRMEISPSWTIKDWEHIIALSGSSSKSAFPNPSGLPWMESAPGSQRLNTPPCEHERDYCLPAALFTRDKLGKQPR